MLQFILPVVGVGAVVYALFSDDCSDECSSSERDVKRYRDAAKDEHRKYQQEKHRSEWHQVKAEQSEVKAAIAEYRRELQTLHKSSRAYRKVDQEIKVLARKREELQKLADELELQFA